MQFSYQEPDVGGWTAGGLPRLAAAEEQGLDAAERWLDAGLRQARQAQPELRDAACGEFAAASRDLAAAVQEWRRLRAALDPAADNTAPPRAEAACPASWEDG